jgi:hypothetical protein
MQVNSGEGLEKREKRKSERCQEERATGGNDSIWGGAGRQAFSIEDHPYSSFFQIPTVLCTSPPTRVETVTRSTDTDDTSIQPAKYEVLADRIAIHGPIIDVETHFTYEKRRKEM